MLLHSCTRACIVGCRAPFRYLFRLGGKVTFLFFQYQISCLDKIKLVINDANREILESISSSENEDILRMKMCEKIF